MSLGTHLKKSLLQMQFALRSLTCTWDITLVLLGIAET